MLLAMPGGPLTFMSPMWLWPAAALLGVAVVAAVLRRVAMPLSSRLLGLFGLLLLCLAAGGMAWRLPAAREVAVMVDLSPSTRSADYRDRKTLETRVKQLVGRAPYRIWYFAGEHNSNIPPGAALPDLPTDRTVYAPPPAGAIVLFSDGQFELPGTPGASTYPVLDPGLLIARDASVTALHAQSGQASVEVSNTGRPRDLTIAGTRGPSPTTVPAGSIVVTRPIDAAATGISARLSPGDLWPENDALSAPLAPPMHAERWIVGSAAAAPPPGWRSFAPAALPTDAGDYLAPSIVVLDNVSAADLSALQQDRLRQYVRDLGGALLLIGGDRAFAAGGWPGSGLEALSPLASTPPRPTTHWMLLADASGSMNGPAGGAGSATLWQLAAGAVVGLLPHLPPDDVVSTGSFSAELTWWTRERSARETMNLPLPPPDLHPNGPTNLRPVLDQIAASAASGMPKELLVLSDAETDLGDPASLSAALRAKDIHLSLLALGDGAALPALRRIAADTGGHVILQQDAAKWAQGVRDLAQAAAPKFLEARPLAVRYTGDLASLPAQHVSPWNRTWLKSGAAPLAEGSADDEHLAAVARWNLGEGAVVAASFAGSGVPLERLADLVARRPSDPRFHVIWQSGPQLQVSVDAGESGDYLNGRALALELSPENGGAPVSLPLPQTGPGRYTLSVPAPRAGTIATLRADGAVIDRRAIAARYPAEFDRIGINRDTLAALADRSGGRIIDPGATRAIDFHWPRRDVLLRRWLAIGGGLLLALSLVVWRARS